MEAGNRRYRITWSEGEPSVEVGRVVIVARKRLSRRVQWPDGKAVKRNGSATMREAIEADIVTVANAFGGDHWRRKKTDPMQLAYCVLKLMRLLRKLERHNLA